MSGLGVIQLVYNAIRDVPDRYSLCTHSLSELLSSDFGQLYRYVQKVYESSVHCRLFAMDWGNPASDVGLVYLRYEALRDLPLWYYLCTHSLNELFSSEFGQLYRTVQQVHKNAVH